MASIGQLTTALASSLRIQENTVTVFVRNLRDAGLILKGGRGPGAARMRALDAARALMAFLAVDRSEPRHAPTATTLLGRFTCQDIVQRGQVEDPDRIDLFSVFDIEPDHTFEDALSKLLAALTDPHFRREVDSNNWATGGGLIQPLKIEFDDGKRRACITFGQTTYVYLDPIEAEIFRAKSSEARARLVDTKSKAVPPAKGLRTERYIFWSEVLPIVECLADDPSRGGVDADS